MKASLFKILFAFGILLLPFFAHAGASHNVVGWGWSSTIGWISFNSTNDHDPNTAGVQPSSIDYGVNLNANNTFSGYAWSPNIGWIQFGGLSGFPTGNGTQQQNANVNGNNVKGWVRAIAADGYGWDGWIALSGATLSGQNYGVTFDGTKFSGYGWGDDVVGWILFHVSDVYPEICADCGVKIGGDANLDVKTGGTSIVGNTSVPYGTIPTFEWTLMNVANATCSVSKTSSGGTTFTAINNITASGSFVGDPLTDASYTYQISCTNPTVLKQSSFTVLPQPPGFSLGATENAKIQFVSAGSADSEEKIIFVTATPSFTNPVTVSITGFPAAMASTTFRYSFDGGQNYSVAPGPTQIISSPYSTGIRFRVRVTRLSGAPAFVGPYTITLTGTGSGAPSATKNILLAPVEFTPIYEEL